METLISILLFVACITSIGPTIAMWYGLKLQVKDESCPEEVKAVKNNKIAIKVLSTITAILVIISLILQSM